MSKVAVPDDVPPGPSVTPLVPVVTTLPVLDTVALAGGHTLATVVWKQVSIGAPVQDSETLEALTAVVLVTPERVTCAVSEAVLPETGRDDRPRLVWPGDRVRLVKPATGPLTPWSVTVADAYSEPVRPVRSSLPHEVASPDCPSQ